MLASTTEQKILNLISDIPDPEIPVITISDLGILREVDTKGDKIIVRITPTYSGCPAMKSIEQDIVETLHRNGYANVEVELIYHPVWTTDWISDDAKTKLINYGIAPPGKTSTDKFSLTGNQKFISCPRCGSMNTALISQFGSTACKALYKCKDCLEPFDYFKCH